jgi:hypothetical protein
MNGLMKCMIVPPKNLYHPVLPFRYIKLLFCLCRSRVQELNTTSECQHLRDAERCLEGTWLIDEVRLAVDRGYKILKVQEVYQYEVTQYDPNTGKGRHFVDYINTFLKVNAVASSYPSWVRPRMMKTYTYGSSIRADKSG